MKKILLFLFVFSQMGLSLVHADSELAEMFSRSFTSNYVSGRCGDNIIGLFQRAEEKRLNLNQAKILEISNRGYSVFGMINVEYARESGPQMSAGERNWYHHVVLEKDGLIYDYDFGNVPKIMTIENYFEKMFLTEKKKSEGGEFYVGREEKLKNYEVVVRSGIEVFTAKRARIASPEGEKMKLDEYLRSYGR